MYQASEYGGVEVQGNTCKVVQWNHLYFVFSIHMGHGTTPAYEPALIGRNKDMDMSQTQQCPQSKLSKQYQKTKLQVQIVTIYSVTGFSFVDLVKKHLNMSN